MLATGKEGEEKPRILSTRRWPVTVHRRSYLFFFDDSKLDRVSYRAVDEYVKTATEM